MGEDDHETLEVVPWQWKVVQTVREKFTCQRERISQPASPFPPDPARLGGGSEPPLAMIVFESRAGTNRLNRQAEALCRKAWEPQPLHACRPGGRSDRVAGAAALQIEAHVRAAERVHGDDTTVPATGPGRRPKISAPANWTAVRDAAVRRVVAPACRRWLSFRFSRAGGASTHRASAGWRGHPAWRRPVPDYNHALRPGSTVAARACCALQLERHARQCLREPRGCRGRPSGKVTPRRSSPIAF